MRPRRAPCIVSAFVTLAALQACTRNDAARSADSVRETSHTVARPRPGSDWDSELGALLVVPSDTENVAVVLYPGEDDAEAPASANVTLVDIGGDTVQVTLNRTDS